MHHSTDDDSELEVSAMPVQQRDDSASSSDSRPLHDPDSASAVSSHTISITVSHGSSDHHLHVPHHATFGIYMSNRKLIHLHNLTLTQLLSLLFYQLLQSTNRSHQPCLTTRLLLNFTIIFTDNNFAVFNNLFLLIKIPVFPYFGF